MDKKDTYKTIEQSFVGEILKEKGSKFIGYAFPISSEGQVSDFIKQLKAEHHKARHWCYAWQLGTENIRFRANDDGEPNNSAGQPIYGQILSKDVTNILVVVVRYFGGTKLGVGGLISAYKIGAKNVLDISKIIEKTIDLNLKFSFEYKDLNKVLRIIKDNGVAVVSQKMEYACDYEIAIRKNDFDKVKLALEQLRCIDFKKENE